MAVAACGGPHIPLQVGRIDATAAGDPGVPEPETNLQDTLVQFSNAGFNTGDGITLTACGHTMGGVHAATFPQVVPTNTTGLSGTDGLEAFDGTVAGFDIDVITDYVHGTGAKGGPLVTTTNKTVNSDFRLYNADSNATMTRLADNPSNFDTECANIFQRMLGTVPNNRPLSRPIDPTTATNLKPYGMALSLDWKGTMTLSGSFRYIQVAGAAAAPGTLTITLVARNRTATTISVTATKSAKDTGTGIWGPTNAYPFTLTFPATTGLSGLSVSGQTFAFQDTMFVNQALSSYSPTLPTFAASPALDTKSKFSFNTTVAVSTS